MTRMYPTDLRYTKDHEWIRPQGARSVVGITHHAQAALGDVVFVELPDVGRKLKAGESFGTVESVKAVSELYSPVSGEVVEVNAVLAKKPEMVNSDPYGEGWMIVVKPDDTKQLDALLDPVAYRQLIGE
jgi:glycine cleavage system H protein